MKRALAVAFVPLFIWACGGEAASEAPPQTAADAAAAPADAPADAGAADKPAGGAEEGWAGEKEAKAEKVPAGAEGTTETRTMDVIQKIVKDNRQPVRDCMDKVQKQLPDLAGDMVIHFVVDPEGKVKKAELNVERSAVKNPEVADCAVKTIMGLKFPPSSRQMESEVNYPFNFKKKQ